MFGQSEAMDIVEPIHQLSMGLVKSKLASKQQKFEDKEARKQAAFLSEEAQKDLALQMRAQSIKGPSFMPLILAGIGTLVLLGGMIFLVSRD